MMRRLLSVLVLTLFCTQVQGASVKKLLKKSKKVVIDEGTKTGFEKGKTACVFTSDDEEIVCAEIYKAKKKKSYIRIKKRKIFKKIEKGMTIKLKGEEQGQTQVATEQGTSTGVKGATNLKVGYVLSPVTPSVYNAIYYADPNQTLVNTLWKADRTSNLSLAGLGVEVGIGIGGSKLNLGFRLRSYKPFTISANYTNDRTRFAETKLSATSTGAWVDFNYFILDLGSMSIDIGNGLDVDIANLTMDTTAKNDNDTTETEIYSATSDFTTISLRTNINFNFFFDPIGFQFSNSILIPVSGTASDSIETSDTENEQYLGEITPEEDVRKAINHRKSSFALEMFFSTYYAF